MFTRANFLKAAGIAVLAPKLVTETAEASPMAVVRGVSEGSALTCASADKLMLGDMILMSDGSIHQINRVEGNKLHTRRRT